MSRDERPSRSGSVSELGQPRQGSGFETTDAVESIHVGCSMLSRIRFQPRNPAAFAMMRCHLGYALHSDEEVAKCLAVDGPGECWKAAPSWRVAPAEPRPRAERELDRQAAIVALDPGGALPAGETPNGVVTEMVVVTEAVTEARVIRIGPSPDRTGTDNGTGG